MSLKNRLQLWVYRNVGHGARKNALTISDSITEEFLKSDNAGRPAKGLLRVFSRNDIGLRSFYWLAKKDSIFSFTVFA